jgi:molybdopterin-containing oxidoreductase family iron-sulfur binding subunit
MIDGKDELTIIQEDIKRALGKPRRTWGMLIDLRKCTACHACTASCVAEQKSPPGIIYRPVYEEETGKFPSVKRRWTPRPCNQCDDPPCVAACPNKGEGKATWKSTKGVTAGVVMINYEQCIGCGRCVLGCPYKARALDGGAFYTEGTPQIEEYEKSPTWEYSKKWPREKNQLPMGTARKCHFCRANVFGDIGDKESLIYKVMKQNKVKVLASVKSAGETKMNFADLKGISPEELSRKYGYPGKVPVFADSAPTKPRVFYILP